MMKMTINPFVEAPLALRMLEISSVAAAVIDCQGKIALVNDCLCDLLGYQPNELIGDSADLVLPPDSFQLTVSQAARGVTFGTRQHAGRNGSGGKKIFARHKVGNHVPVVMNLHWLESLGQRFYVVQMIHDGQRDIDRELLQSERLSAISQMISGLAHESRNALQKAVASLDLLELDLQYNSEQMKLSQRIRTSILELLDIYDEVRRYAEPLEIKTEKVNLVDLFLTTSGEFQATREESPVQVSVASKSDFHEPVLADRERMKQVFWHLLRNTSDASKGIARLEIQCNRKMIQNVRWQVFQIRDHGSGFLGVALERAFEAFFTTKQRGSGLGLAICRRIVQAHGGEISAKNHVAGGAVITIELPIRT